LTHHNMRPYGESACYARVGLGSAPVLGHNCMPIHNRNVQFFSPWNSSEEIEDLCANCTQKKDPTAFG